MKNNSMTGGKATLKFAFLAIAFLIFALMLFLNFHTGLICDDYAYLFDFSEEWHTYAPPAISSEQSAGRITSLGQIWRSMQAHRWCMNGRVIAHALGQAFLLFPSWIFKIINAAMFVAQLCIMCAIADLTGRKISRKMKLLLFVLSFALIWLFQPSFGQVNLWLDGSINYLWSAVLALIYVFAYIRYYLEGSFSKSGIVNLAFMFFSFVVGAYSENSGGAMIVLAVCTIFCKCVSEKGIRKNSVIALFSLVATLVGYYYLLSAPIELMGKMSDLPLIERILAGGNMLWLQSRRVLPLLAATIVLYVLAVVCRVDRKTLVLSGIVIISALSSALCLVLAAYIALRCFYITVALLVAACLMLLPALITVGKPTKCLCVILTAFIFVVLPQYMKIGIKDILHTYYVTSTDEAQIIASAEQGIKDVYILKTPDFASTEYSPAYDLRYITTDPETYPNCYMAKYYGVDSITLID